MPGTSDKIKGRAKVATGAVTGDKQLENEGRVDRMTGEAKDRLADATSALEGLLDTARTKATHALHATQRRLEGLLNR